MEYNDLENKYNNLTRMGFISRLLRRFYNRFSNSLFKSSIYDGWVEFLFIPGFVLMAAIIYFVIFKLTRMWLLHGHLVFFMIVMLYEQFLMFRASICYLFKGEKEYFWKQPEVILITIINVLHFLSFYFNQNHSDRIEMSVGVEIFLFVIIAILLIFICCTESAIHTSEYNYIKPIKAIKGVILFQYSQIIMCVFELGVFLNIFANLLIK